MATARESRIAEATVSAIDFMSRLLGAIESGNWHYSRDKLRQLDRTLGDLGKQLARTEPAAGPPVAAYVAEYSRPHRIGRALYGTPAGQEVAEPLEAACRMCGCTENAACAGGCQWVPNPLMVDLCSSCVLQLAQLPWTPVGQPSPLVLAEDAKRRRDFLGEVDALMGGERDLKAAPWYPAQLGDVVHVAYGGIPDVVSDWGETYLVGPSEDGSEGYLSLRLIAHSLPAEMGDGGAGAFAVDDEPDPIFTPWFEAGPAALTIVRDGVVVHGGALS